MIQEGNSKRESVKDQRNADNISRVHKGNSKPLTVTLLKDINTHIHTHANKYLDYVLKLKNKVGILQYYTAVKN